MRAKALGFFVAAATACEAARPALQWRVIDEREVITSATGDAIRTSTIEVRSGTRADTVDHVADPAAFLVGDSLLVGILWDTSSSSRRFFRYSSRTSRLEALPAPSDLSRYFHDVSISPDGQFVLYVAVVDTNWNEAATVRAWPNGAIVMRGASTPSCECDIDRHHARWATTDSFELATKIDQERYQRVSGSMRRRSLGVDTIRGEPEWHLKP
jgi:hypothetical protein